MLRLEVRLRLVVLLEEAWQRPQQRRHLLLASLHMSTPMSISQLQGAQDGGDGEAEYLHLAHQRRGVANTSSRWALKRRSLRQGAPKP